MKTMAEVLAGHHISVGNDGGWYCSSFGCESFAHFHEATQHQADALAAAGYGPVKAATVLIRDLTDPDDCSFDHHGGCQAHGYLDLEIGEMCPQLEAKAWAYNHAANLDAP